MAEDNPPRITLSPVNHSVAIRYDDRTVAVTNTALCLAERGYPARLYIPHEAITGARLVESATRTHCPFKGDATYYDLIVSDAAGGEVRLADAAWSYASPIADVAPIDGRIAFDHPGLSVA